MPVEVNKTNSNVQTIVIDLSYGLGRVEFITDAWHATAILKELMDEGQISEDLSQNEITALATHITNIRNTRFKDARHDKANEFNELVRFFGYNGLVDLEDYRFFSILNDIWSNERFYSRYHGQTVNFGIHNYLDRNEINSLQYKIFKDVNFGIFCEFNKYNALSQKIQFDQNYRLELGKSYYYEYDGKLFRSSKYLNFKAEYSLAFLLNLRNHLITSFNFGTFGRDVYPTAAWSYTNLDFIYNRYFSPTLRMQIKFTHRLRHNYYHEINYTITNNSLFTLSFNYYIF